MSFLFPLYLAAGLAVGLPILFHLIRQTPKGRQVFSSTMFLSPSPPRVTKRSRIEDWLLLLLRGFALLLLACAFARPFLRAQELEPDAARTGTRYLVLLDLSASMRRESCWPEARRQLAKFLQSIRPEDSLEVVGFDATTRDVATFAEWNSVPPNSRATLVLERIDRLEPTWLPTELGKAMIEGAERLQEQADERHHHRTLVVISDFQAGARWMPLQGFRWPTDVEVMLLPVVSEPAANAALHFVQSTGLSEERTRVRVTNSPGSVNETFLLGWLGPFDAVPTAAETMSSAIRVTVPTGQSRVVAVPVPPEEFPGERLALLGDEVGFDNVQFVVPRKKRTVRLGYFGDSAKEPAGDALRGFLGPMFPDAPSRSVVIVEPSADAWGSWETTIDFAIIPNSLSDDDIHRLLPWIRAGGRCLFIARDVDQAALLYRLLHAEPAPIVEAEVKGYRMIGKLDLTHPVLAPFDDPRYSDFTKVRIWHHRQFDLSGIPNVQLLMSFEDGSPALAEIPLGQGRLFLLGTSWSRDDSELAVWSKFIPIMNGLLDYSLGGNSRDRATTVGDSVSHAELDLGPGKLSVIVPAAPDSHGNAPKPGAAAPEVLSPEQTFTFTVPGIYEFRSADSSEDATRSLRIAANLAPDESRTEPLDLDLLKGAGVVFATPLPSAESPPRDPEMDRQLLNRELESKQQWWRWLLVGALALLLCETILSAILTRFRLRPAASGA